MLSPIEQALTSLAPGLLPLPDELISLSTALLSQSRALAPTLKPEEEIGRIYACAEIACDRSKARLGLDKLVPRPPLAPLVYKRLFTYLAGLLAAPPGAGGTTPRRTRRTDAKPSPGTPSRRAEEKRGVNSQPTTPSGRAEKRARPTWLPGFADAMAARLSAALGHGDEVAALVTAGAEAVLALGSGISAERVPGLLVVLGLFVHGRRTGKGLETEEFVELRGKGIEAVRGLEEGRVMGEEEMAVDMKGLLRQAVGEGWLEMDWFTGVEREGEQRVERGGKTAKTPLRRSEKHAKRPTNEVEDVASNPAGLAVGLGTMFQDAVDWLSRRAEYEEWKAGIMERIEQERPAEVTTGKRTSREARVAGF